VNPGRYVLFVVAGMMACSPGVSFAGDVPDVGIDQHLGAQVPMEVTFRDEAGRPITLRECLGGKPTILVLAYYRCPMLCTEVLNGLTDALRALPYNVGDRFNVVTVSFDPQELPVLAAAKKSSYLAAYNRPGAEAGWHFLTGEKSAITALTQAVGFRYKYDPKIDQFAHASGIIVLTPDGKVSRYFYGIIYPPADLRLGLVESSDGRIGTLADQVVLLCYHYDPATGKYSPAILGLMRIAGVVTLVGIGLLMLLARRRRTETVAQCSTGSSQLHNGPPDI